MACCPPWKTAALFTGDIAKGNPTTIQDTRGNLHARDGMCATKNRPKTTGLDLQAFSPLSFHLAGPRANNLELGDGYELPPYPADYPDRAVELIQADSGEWQTRISDGQEDLQTGA